MSNFAESWRQYHKRRNLLLLAFFGFLPVVVLVELFAYDVFGNDTPAFVAAVGWMAFFAVAGIRFLTFRCPRCGKWFFSKGWYHSMFARRCLHCSLLKYASAEHE